MLKKNPALEELRRQDEEEIAGYWNKDGILGLLKAGIENYVNTHDPDYNRAFRTISEDSRNKVLGRHKKRIDELFERYATTLDYIVELALGDAPSQKPDETLARDMFGLLGCVCVFGDYYSQEIENEVIRRVLDNAALRHAEGATGLANRYRSLEVSRRVLAQINPYLRKKE